MTLRTRITIPEGPLKRYLENDFNGDTRFEIIRLATNGLMNESKNYSQGFREFSEKTSSDFVAPSSEKSNAKEQVQEVDFGDDLLEIR